MEHAGYRRRPGLHARSIKIKIAQRRVACWRRQGSSGPLKRVGQIFGPQRRSARPNAFLGCRGVFDGRADVSRHAECYTCILLVFHRILPLTSLLSFRAPPPPPLPTARARRQPSNRLARLPRFSTGLKTNQAPVMRRCRH